jgi:hypothetical protein
MARRPHNFTWLGRTPEQVELLEFLDYLGNNGWARNSQTDALMPSVMGDFAAAGLSLDDVVESMRSLGYHDGALHQLRRWESKRTTGKFGR